MRILVYNFIILEFKNRHNILAGSYRKVEQTAQDVADDPGLPEHRWNERGGSTR